MTMSSMTTSPLFEQTKQINAMNSTTEYKTAVSISTRMSGIIVLFVVRAVEVLLSIDQMRYTSNPELNKLVAIVRAKKAVTHGASTWANTFPEELPDCDAQ